VSGYEELRRSAAVHPVGRDVLAVTGQDAATYLQGQCSQDIEALVAGGTADALLLSPRGKVDALVRVTRRGPESFLVDVDAGHGEAVVERLTRFRLRVQVEIATLPWSCVAVRGPAAGAVMLTGEAASPGEAAPPGEARDRPLLLPVSWPGWTGFDLLGPTPPGGDPVASWIAAEVTRCDRDAWEAARIEAGVPVNGREITPDTIAAELGLVDRTVSFAKGCYTGQELVARLDARGSRVARVLRGIVLDGRGDPPPVGAEVWTRDGAHELGHLTSVAPPQGSGPTVALALLHRRVEPPEAVVVRWGAGSAPRQMPAEARSLPFGG